MRVVHITTIDEGGAYKAVVRMQEALRLVGVDSQILLRNKLHKGHEGEVYLDNGIKSIVSKGKNLLNLLLSRKEIAYESFGSDVSKHALIKNADIVVIHWCNSFLSYKSIKKLLNSGKQIVFFMHDTWLFTGGCHVNFGCEKYKTGCGNCPYINGDKEKDLSYKNFLTKQELLKEYPIHIAGPSRWMADCASQSAITSRKEITYIPNCINGDIFRPIDNVDAIKRKYDIPLDKKVILFGAAFNGTENKNKGFQYLLKALEYFPKEEYFLLIFGNCREEDIAWKQDYKLLGYIYSEQDMADVYNLADVYVTPSLQESFGFTVCEAMSCGTPTVAFPVGGIKEQIIHKKNGYLAEYLDAQDIAKGIEFCTRNQAAVKLREEACNSATDFHYKSVNNQYKEYFESICSGRIKQN